MCLSSFLTVCGLIGPRRLPSCRWSSSACARCLSTRWSTGRPSRPISPVPCCLGILVLSCLFSSAKKLRNWYDPNHSSVVDNVSRFPLHGILHVGYTFSCPAWLEGDYPRTRGRTASALWGGTDFASPLHGCGAPLCFDQETACLLSRFRSFVTYSSAGRSSRG